MKVRNLCALVICFFTMSVQATTPFKNLYVTAQVYPSGAGEVYLTAKEGDRPYIKYETGEYGEFVELKYTCGENGGQDQYRDHAGYVLDATDSLGMYEAVIKIRPNEGYEFVCLAVEESPTEIYDPSICLQRHTGDKANDYEFFWNYEMDEESLINVNTYDHEVDMTSDEVGDGEDAHQVCFNNYGWNDEPDRQLIAIFRKIGDDTPCFEDGRYADLIGDVDGNEEVNLDDAKALTEYLVFQRSDINLEYSDVNGDNNINIADAIAIVKKVLGK